MKVFLDEDEWYPVYTVTDRKGFSTETVDLSEEELKEFLKVHKKFSEWQARLRKMVREEG